MKKISLVLAFSLLLATCGCVSTQVDASIVATTRPVYDFTTALCSGTDLTVCLLITESVSCLHDYSLSTRQMKSLENADMVIASGAGLEAFDIASLIGNCPLVDASANVPLLECSEAHDHDHGHDHDHEEDAHIWLSPANAKIMAQNICANLCSQYPNHALLFRQNLSSLLAKLDDLQTYGETQLSNLSCRELITFHDGFAYMAHAFDLNILAAVEEESGSEASAKDLIELIEEVRHHNLPAVFCETNGSVSACSIIARETGVKVYTLDMCMGSGNYFDNMYSNIDTLKEALG